MADRIGQHLGNYRLTRLLGQGGFAEVYLGEHMLLGTMVAIKVLHTQVSQDEVEHFQQEGRLLASLKHPSIVRILDFGLDGQTPYLVMEYASNGSLRNRHPKGSMLHVSTVVRYVKQVAEALQYAHDRKIVHRDIKPENMLIGEENEILLSDFGIALIAHSSYSQSAKDIAGTIAYMAPEQIDAHPRPASDQYSLGVVVYEWLCGALPFQGTYIETAIKHRLTAPPPLHTHLPTLLPDVETVVLIALRKQAQDRFVSISAFATALEQASQNGLPTIPAGFEGTGKRIQPQQGSQDGVPTKSVAFNSMQNHNQQARQDGHTASSTPNQPAPMTSKPRVSRRAILLGAIVATTIAACGGSVFAFSQGHAHLPLLDFRAGDLNYVTNLADDGIGSLRWALTNAPEGSTITFDASLKGTIVRPSSQQCRDLLISKSLTVQGPGAQVLALNGGGHDRVFSVSSGISVTISGLTIEKGEQGCTGYPGGGAIYNEGTLTLNHCAISNSIMPDGLGGGIDNEGTLTLNNCTVTGNSGSGGQNMRGGGIYNGIVNSKAGGSSELTLNNCTVTGNTATGAYGDSGFGGGLYNAAGSKLTLNNSKVVGNSATGPKSVGGGIYNEGTLLLKNSTVSGNSASLAKSENIYNTGIVKYG